MNRKIILLQLQVVFFLMGINLQAQDRRNELELGIGIWNTNEILNTFSDMIISSLPAGIKMDDDNSLGSIHLGYRYRFTERLGMGGLFAYDYSTGKGILNGREEGKFYKRHYTLALEADYVYIRKKNFRMYGLAGVGGTLYNLDYKDHTDKSQNDSDTTPYFTFQITPVGLRFGSWIGGFLELGFGYRGILNAGFFINL
ncbi:MAG: porin family protein [Bacteroidales bacterium]|jgi:opacity protein-like surface antigen|nr:porin family protein [Bacteroidales bacterium]